MQPDGLAVPATATSSMERAEISPFDQQTTPMTYRAWPQPLLPDIETVLSPIHFTPSPFARSASRSASPRARRPRSCLRSPSPSPSPSWRSASQSSPAYSREPSPRTLPTRRRRRLEARRAGTPVAASRSSSRVADTVLESMVPPVNQVSEPLMPGYVLGDAVEEIVRQNRFERISTRVSPCYRLPSGLRESGEVLERGEVESAEMLSLAEWLASPGLLSPSGKPVEELSGAQRRGLGKAVAGLKRRWSRRLSEWLIRDGLKRRDSVGVLGKRMSEGAPNAAYAEPESGTKRAKHVQEGGPPQGTGRSGEKAMRRQTGVSLGREVGMEEQRRLERDLALQNLEHLTPEEKQAIAAQMKINPAHLAVTPPGLDVRAFSRSYQDHEAYFARLEIAVWTAKARGVFDRKTLKKRLSQCSSRRNSRRLQLKAIEVWQQELSDERRSRERRFCVTKRERTVSEHGAFEKRSRAAFEIQPEQSQSVRRRFSVWQEIANLAGVAGTSGDIFML